MPLFARAALLLYAALGVVIWNQGGWGVLLLWAVAGAGVGTLLFVFAPSLGLRRPSDDTKSTPYTVPDPELWAASQPAKPVARATVRAGGADTVFAGTFEMDVVGESRYQVALEKINGGRSRSSARTVVEAKLIPEDDNPVDKMAIRVDIQGRTVGYLDRRDARVYRQRLTEAGATGAVTRCPALIVGDWDRDGDRGHFGVKLDLDAT